MRTQAIDHSGSPVADYGQGTVCRIQMHSGSKRGSEALKPSCCQTVLLLRDLLCLRILSKWLRPLVCMKDPCTRVFEAR